MRQLAESEAESLSDLDLDLVEAEPQIEVPLVEQPDAVKEAGSEQPFPLAEPGDYYEGLWCGKPNYKCPFCFYATLEGQGAVELHILFKIEQGNTNHMKALELR